MNKMKESRLKNSYVVAILTLLLSGCATLPAPDTQVKNVLAYTADVREKYAADEKWWQAYQDTQLNELVDQALENNIDLAKSAISVNKALYEANLVSADLVPTFSASASGSVTKNLDSGPSTRSYGGSVGLSYEVDLWRRLADSASASVWSYRATQEDLAAARLTLINSVVNTYFNLVYLKAAIDQQKSNIQNDQKILQTSQSKYTHGKVASLEPAQARQSLLNAESALISLENEQKTAMQTLRNLLNLHPDESLTLSLPDLVRIAPLGVNVDIPLSVLANRPDLKAAEYRLQSAFKDLRATEKSWYPSITIGSTISASSDRFRTAFNVPFLMGGVSIDLPFLQWNRIKWNIKLSEAEYENTLLNFKSSLTTALNEVDSLYFKYIKAQQEYRQLVEKHQAAQKIYHYYSARYQYGSAEFRDWLDAKNTFDSAYLNMLNGRYSLLVAENNVYQAMAGRYANAAITPGTLN